MKFQTYNATPGLERYPRNERYDLWRSLHKRLQREDSGYRHRFNTFRVSVECLSVFATMLWLCDANPAFAWAATICACPAVVYLAFNQQYYMNRKIGALLQSM